ncbi:MAG TPA: carboxypeptidase-like regulatory domain-containing protein [Kofleriaceae bacterium]|nr:carboxypeptidase-like regulatory domain-containing protein [Kofleriaceae bacterium]
MRILVIVACLARMAWAQSTTGTVRGTVIDTTTHDPAIGATIVAVGASPEQQQVVITDENGQYFITELAPGSYKLVVYYESATEERPNIAVEPARTTVVNLRIDTRATSAPVQIVTLDRSHMCCAGPCNEPSRVFGGVLGAAAGTQVAIEARANDDRRKPFGIAVRGAGGVRHDDGHDEATGTVELELSYAATRRIELALAGGVVLGTDDRWRVAPGVRLFATDHVFVQPQVIVPALGVSLVEGVRLDLGRAIGLSVFAEQSVDRDGFAVTAGLGVHARR